MHPGPDPVPLKPTAKLQLFPIGTDSTDDCCDVWSRPRWAWNSQYCLGVGNKSSARGRWLGSRMLLRACLLVLDCSDLQCRGGSCIGPSSSSLPVATLWAAKQKSRAAVLEEGSFTLGWKLPRGTRHLAVVGGMATPGTVLVATPAKPWGVEQVGSTWSIRAVLSAPTRCGGADALEVGGTGYQ